MQVETGSPEPICDTHSRKIISCVTCCVLIWETVGLLDVDDRHSWAVSNVYKAKELW